MIRQNFRLAFRQLEKYRLQSLVSIVSLAIGFACFALASMWIKYETTYDAFHKDAEQLYTFLSNGYINVGDVKTTHLDQVPEISEYTLFQSTSIKPVNQEDWFDEHLLEDENYLSIFHIEFIEGGPGFMHDEGQVAISEKFAHHFFGDESPIGKELIDGSWDIYEGYEKQRTRIVTGVFKDWEGHSNFPMNLLSKVPEKDKNFWETRGTYVIRLHPSAEADSVYKKLYDIIVKGNTYFDYELIW
ncbi:MAG: ABC transporter permease, partial [Bacteroidaceae bacterium]|nr:ABC transporter permease [Bacteroidaceae bacterium]